MRKLQAVCDNEDLGYRAHTAASLLACLAASCGMCDPTSPEQEWKPSPVWWSSESYPQDHQGSPHTSVSALMWLLLPLWVSWGFLQSKLSLCGKDLGSRCGSIIYKLWDSGQII